MRIRHCIATFLLLSSGVWTSVFAQNWISRFDVQGASIDEGRILLPGPNGGSIIVGSSVAKAAGWNATRGWDVAAAAYDSGGTKRWSAVFDGPSHNDDRATCALADGSGNVYIGARSWDAATRCFWPMTTLARCAGRGASMADRAEKTPPVPSLLTRRAMSFSRLQANPARD